MGHGLFGGYQETDLHLDIDVNELMYDLLES